MRGLGRHWRFGSRLCRRAGRPLGGRLGGLRRERPGHEGSGGLVGGGVLKGDGAVSHRFSASTDPDEELSQMGAQPNVVRSGLHRTCQRSNQWVGHSVSLEADSDAGAGVTVWNAFRSVHRITDVCTDVSVRNLRTLRS